MARPQPEVEPGGTDQVLFVVSEAEPPTEADAAVEALILSLEEIDRLLPVDECL